MANKKSAKKRVDIAERNRQRNRAAKSAIRTAMRKATEALEQKLDAETVKDRVNTVYSRLDGAVLKGIVHKNTAARYKSRLMGKVNTAAKEA